MTVDPASAHGIVGVVHLKEKDVPMRYACMLRAVNVSGHRKVAMPELAESCRQLGFDAVGTYLQSGNILLDSAASPDEVERVLQQGLATALGHADIDVLVRTAESLEAVIDGLPKAWHSHDRSTLHFSFLQAPPTKPLAIEHSTFFPDEFALGDRVVYVHCPQGYGRTKLTNNFFERHAGARATTRNWNTVNKLIELARQ